MEEIYHDIRYCF